MPRTIEVTISPSQRGQLVDRLMGRSGIANISVLASASVSPPGDIVRVQASNEAVRAVLRILEELSDPDGVSFTISEPTALVMPSQRKAIEHESNEAPWEEMNSLLRRDTNPSINYLALMTLAGGIAAMGLLHDTLHIVIGAMLLAPGFEPLVRITYGPVTGRWSGSRMGALSAAVGYVMLALGAAAAVLIAPPGVATVPSELSDQHWINYWTSFKWSGVVVAVLAGIAGTVIVNSRRTVFAAGVMVALALIPSMAIFGMGLAVGDPALALSGLGRWAVDAGCVLGAAVLTMAAKRSILHRRDPLF